MAINVQRVIFGVDIIFIFYFIIYHIHLIYFIAVFISLFILVLVINKQHTFSSRVQKLIMTVERNTCCKYLFECSQAYVLIRCIGA